MNDQQREMAVSLRTFNEAPRVNSQTSLSAGRAWALCGIIADNFERHDPGFDRNAFMATCGF